MLGSPILCQGLEENHVPTFWLLLYGHFQPAATMPVHMLPEGLKRKPLPLNPQERDYTVLQGLYKGHIVSSYWGPCASDLGQNQGANSSRVANRNDRDPGRKELSVFGSVFCKNLADRSWIRDSSGFVWSAHCFCELPGSKPP